MRWPGHVARIWKRRGAYTVLEGEPGPRGRLRHFWEGTIILKWIEYRVWGVDGIALVQDREKWWTAVNTVRNLRVSQE